MEHLRTWSANGFRLELFDTYRTDSYGKCVLAFKFYHDDELIFEGDDFHASPLHAIDSDQTVGGLLNFLSLRPGDTDQEYFEGYSTRQMEWCRAHGEALSWHVEELENPVSD